MRTRLLMLLIRLFALLPLAATAALGSAIGKLLFLFPNRRQQTARINLSLCFPELTNSARERLLRRNLIELGCSLTELCALWTFDREKLNRIVRRTSGENVISDALKRGKGLILAAPHLGAWELVGIYCSMRYPITGLFRPIAEAGGGIMCRARQRFGARMVPTNSSGIRALYKALDRDEIIWIMPDQVPASRNTSVFAKFFGMPASSMVLLSRLAIKTGAPVVFAYAERLSRGRGYHMHFLPAPTTVGNDDIEHSATVINEMVEQCARALPEQYLWSYKRFRVAPPGKRPPY